MKKTVSVLSWVHFILIAFLPFGTLLFSCFGYTFELVSVIAFAIVTALLSICFAVLSSIEKEACKGGLMKMLSALSAPLSLVNAVFYMRRNSTVWVVVSMFVCIGCCLYFTIKHGKPLALKITALVLSVFMLFPIGLFGFFALILGNFGHITVVQSVESPSGTYCAKVIDSDQGALGGNTLVDVYENKEINALVFKISRKSQSVYCGNWGEFENMDIYWKDDGCLVINSVEYKIE